jgi:GST-like protein
MKVKRQLDVLDRRLADREFTAGPEDSIADMAILHWYGGLAQRWAYNLPSSFLARAIELSSDGLTRS